MAKDKKFRFAAVLVLDSDSAEVPGEWQFRAWKSDGEEVEVHLSVVTPASTMSEFMERYEERRKANEATNDEEDLGYLRNAQISGKMERAVVVGKNKVEEKSESYG